MKNLDMTSTNATGYAKNIRSPTEEKKKSIEQIVHDHVQPDQEDEARRRQKT